MHPYERQLLEGLRAFLWGGGSGGFLEEPEQWQALWRLAGQQKVLPMVADVLLQPYGRAVGGGEALAQVRQHALAGVADQTRRSAAFLEVYRHLLDGGTRPLVVKGALCRALYGQGDLRASADEDLLVCPGEFQGVCRGLEECGLRRSGGGGEEQVTSYLDETTGLYLELHQSLFSPRSAAYGGFNAFFQDAFAHAVVEEVPGGSLWTLRPDEHLLYLMLHSFKHFLHSGFGIRQVCDICLFANFRGGALDWAVLFGHLEQVRADVFAANLLEIGRAWLGFSHYPPAVEGVLAHYGPHLDCTDLLGDLLQGGIYGGSSLARRHSSLITLNAVTEGANAGGTRLLRTVFPRRRELEGAYPYLHKHPYLLPLAWTQRIGRYASRGAKGRGPARESLSIGAARVALMKKYGVIS